MKVCEKCKGLGSVPDPKITGSMNRCADCNGTGRQTTDSKGETSFAPVKEK